jgi:hypothetical protein
LVSQVIAGFQTWGFEEHFASFPGFAAKQAGQGADY